VVREAGAIDNATYRALNKVDTLAASAALRRLRDAGRLAGEVRASYSYFADGDVVYAKVTPCFENGKGAVLWGLENGQGLWHHRANCFAARQTSERGLFALPGDQ
jgi:hypothetical protein